MNNHRKLQFWDDSVTVRGSLDHLMSPEFWSQLESLCELCDEITLDQMATQLAIPVEVLGFWIARDHVAQAGQTAIVRNKNDEPIAVLSLAETAWH